MDWIKNLKGSFGSVDYQFAKHPLDKDRARKAISEAIENGVEFKEFIKVARTFLKDKDCSPKHIQKEIKKVKELKSYFD